MYKRMFNKKSSNTSFNFFITMSFNEQCYKLLKKVPKGKVTTYKDIAEALGTRAYRAVGNAMNQNPYAFKIEDVKRAKNKEFLSTPQVPCHRVVNANGNVGGFASGIKKKIQMLKQEGIQVNDNKIVDFEKIRYKF